MIILILPEKILLNRNKNFINHSKKEETMLKIDIKNNNKYDRFLICCRVMFGFFIPIITTIITFFFAFRENDVVNEYWTLKVLPILLGIWFLLLVTKIILYIIRYLKKNNNENIALLIWESCSIGLFLVCCFLELFSISILCGGFHAS